MRLRLSSVFVNFVRLLEGESSSGRVLNPRHVNEGALKDDASETGTRADVQ
jgi:hypothetical protein